jgi:hypothetical protein
MNDLLEPGDLHELRNLRAEVTGRRPEDLPGARAMLLAEVHRTRQADPGNHRRRRLPGPRPPAARWLRPAVLAGAAAALAAVLTVTLLPGSPARQPGPAQNTPQNTPGNTPGTPALTAAYVLNHAASAAASAALPVPRPDQYIYVSSVTTYVATEVGRTGAKSWLYRTNRQIWLSASGLRAGLLQIVARPNLKLPWGPVPPAISGDPVSWMALNGLSCPGKTPFRSTYAFLATLPTDPAMLHAWIYRHPNGGQAADNQAWTDIGDMLREMLVPPKLAAALFKVAATIPGTAAVPLAKNAIGRSGVAVSRSGNMLIFDPKTYQFLGEGAVLTKPVKGEGPAGTVVASTAQLQVKVVSTLPDIPPSQVEKDGSTPNC